MSRPIIIIICLSLALILAIGLVWPKYQEIKFLEESNKEKKAEIAGREKYLQDLKKAERELQNYQDQLLKIDSSLPSEPGLEVLLNFLQKTSSQSGLILTDIKSSVSQAAEDLKGLKEAELSFGVFGDYNSFKNFLSLLERNSRLIEVESISFSSPEKEGLQRFNLKIKVYSY